MAENLLSVVCDTIESEKDFLVSISQDIWNNPELKFEEHHAHDVLTEALAKFGFKVTRNYLLPTAFRAEYSSNKASKTSIAVILEYDALPEIGHACGHNLIAEAGLAAAIAVKAAMEKDSSLSGKVVVLGTPAEEGGGGKIKMIKKGAFKDIDAAMMVHPRPFTIFSPPTLTIISCTIDFTGKESHASAFPWKGLNALDAAVSFYQMVGLLRQQIKPTWRIHAIITKGGTVPNIIPGNTQVVCFLRAPTNDEVYELKAKVENCLKGASTASGCSYSVKYEEEILYEYLRTNQAMVDIFGQYAEKLGLPETDISQMNSLPAGSTDMGNVSNVVPAIQPVYDIQTDAANHTRKFAEASESAHAQGPTLVAAKAMAMTVITLLKNPDILNNAKIEFCSKK